MTSSILVATTGHSEVSFWLDDLSRDRLNSGNLQTLIDEFQVKGVTTNPTIFANALRSAESYAGSLAKLRESGAAAVEAVESLMCEDVQLACDVFSPIFEASNGYDGFVSIEVSPEHANDVHETVAEATRLWERIARPNLLVKVPGTTSGLEAVSQLIAHGISVNVTLLFSLERYRAVTNAYLSGLERARRAGFDLSSIHSVASFFVSRIDTAVDAQLRHNDTEEARRAEGRTAVANARSAYEIFLQQFSTERAKYLLELGANIQRPLWASTGVKDPRLADTLYVDELRAPFVVNTMPEATLRSVHDHGRRDDDTIQDHLEESRALLDELAELGVDYEHVVLTLEQEGVEKFLESHRELLDTVKLRLHG